MKNLLLLGLLAVAPVLGFLTRVSKRNEAVQAGRRAYLRGEANLAAQAFARADVNGAGRPADPYLVLNLAHAQARAGQLAAAQRSYERLLTAPAPVGSVARQQLAVLQARQGQLAQALGLLRQALLLDPNNQGARYNYEVLSDYLNQRQDTPAIPPPAAGSDGKKQKAPKEQPQEKKAGSKEGTDRPEDVNKPNPGSGSPETPPESRPDPGGQPDQQPAGGAGSNSLPSPEPGSGAPQPVASGSGPGARRGLDRSGAAGSPAPGGSSRGAGTEAAAPEDLRMQTQRERLKAMNLSPAQARQLLEALRMQEQQYLQQLKRPAPGKPDPGKPSW
ncbi:hypothetical protein GCM10023185_06680 [Hymenobacter saemangeumensis]|uniref:Tetratricopeptide repeat protein n=1 Tax=Hymenobacter saemangeumensis TaxID=1084522 RepID=A0ABP8I227_9BACT